MTYLNPGIFRMRKIILESASAEVGEFRPLGGHVHPFNPGGNKFSPLLLIGDGPISLEHSHPIPIRPDVVTSVLAAGVTWIWAHLSGPTSRAVATPIHVGGARGRGGAKGETNLFMDSSSTFGILIIVVVASFLVLIFIFLWGTECGGYELCGEVASIPVGFGVFLLRGGARLVATSSSVILPRVGASVIFLLFLVGILFLGVELVVCQEEGLAAVGVALDGVGRRDSTLSRHDEGGWRWSGTGFGGGVG